ncbi:MAG: electron transfer flavoprotein subunit alpha/FixB family protein [Pseudomonadota bacterium]
MVDIWILVQHREGTIEAPTFGLTAEAHRLIAELGGEGTVTAVVLGPAPAATLETLGNFGVGRVLHIVNAQMSRYNGEYFSQALFHEMKSSDPTCLLAAQSAPTDDLCPRLAAMLDTCLVTRAMDFHMKDDGTARAIRPLANGYLFEEIGLAGKTPPIVSFLPAVLLDTAPWENKPAPLVPIIPQVPAAAIKTTVTKVLEAAPEDLALEEADIIAAGGRGVGKGEAFDIIHRLARAIGGTVGATRPVIDWGTLPYERQIGQTGKYVAPRLIINCGISGANEYTAGIEKSGRVIAIDSNPRARIFRFADLGVIGDVHEILPVLISRIEELKK